MEGDSEDDVTVIEVNDEQVDVEVKYDSCTELHEKIIETEKESDTQTPQSITFHRQKSLDHPPQK